MYIHTYIQNICIYTEYMHIYSIYVYIQYIYVYMVVRVLGRTNCHFFCAHEPTHDILHADKFKNILRRDHFPLFNIAIRRRL